MQRILSVSLVLAATLVTDSLVAQSRTQQDLQGSAIAEALLEYGRAHDDPESIIAAVGIFAKSRGDEAAASDLSRLLAEALALRPGDPTLIAYADRVAGAAAATPAADAGNDDEDDDEKSRQAPAFLQNRSAPAAPAATPPVESSDGAPASAADAEKGDAGQGDASSAAPTPPAQIAAYQYSYIEMALSIGLLIFGAVLVGLQAALMISQKRFWDDWAIKVTGLTLVITSGLLLITAGYSEEQAAPMMGMLGTVAGYLLGKEGSS